MKVRLGTRMGALMILTLVTISVLVVWFAFSGLNVLNGNHPPETPVSTITTQPEPYLGEATLLLTKLRIPPKVYVELTDKEFKKFPVLQLKLEDFKKLGWGTFMIIIPYKEWSYFNNYFEAKYHTNYRCLGFIFMVFKYQEDTYYNFMYVFTDYIGKIENKLELRKQEIPPEEYVELTKEEVIQFPVLQRGLEIFESNNQAQVQITISPQDAWSLLDYIIVKYQTKYECVDISRMFLNYRDELYYEFMIITPIVVI